MSALLDQAIARVRELAEGEQELAAQVLLAFAEFVKLGVYKLSPEERAAIEESRAQVRGAGLASDGEVLAAWGRFLA